jgi:hypothetical protein
VRAQYHKESLRQRPPRQWDWYPWGNQLPLTCSRCHAALHVDDPSKSSAGAAAAATSGWWQRTPPSYTAAAEDAPAEDDEGDDDGDVCDACHVRDKPSAHRYHRVLALKVRSTPSSSFCCLSQSQRHTKPTGLLV